MISPLKKISLARDFSKHPGPRKISQGPDSGELFRRHLVRYLKEADILEVNLNGTSGLGSSFIDEAFGKLISVERMSPEEFSRRIRVVSDEDESYLIELADSVRKAKIQVAV